MSATQTKGIDYQTILPYIEKGLISEQKHPEDSDVRIFNYTQHCQFEQAWDDVTKTCRGLILNVRTGEVLARPFPKFFNYGEYLTKGWEIPAEVPMVTEKLDGSLGILYTLNGKHRIATRGSFTSDQAIWATDWWQETMGPGLYDTRITYLFEIIYPANRVVVNYDFSGLVHLASLETSSGSLLPHILPMRGARAISSTNLEELATLDEPNSEGFVAFFPNANLRIKIKFPEYVRLHKLVTGLSEIAIWEHLRDGKTLEDLIEKVPDEFFQWVKGVERRLRLPYDEIYSSARVAVDGALAYPTRKEQAIAIQGATQWPAVAFAMLDDKDPAPIIWRLIRPRGRSGFKSDIDL